MAEIRMRSNCSMGICRQLPVGIVQGLAPGEAGFHVVPEFDGVFTQLPAEINHSSVPHVREVAKSLVDILKYNAHVTHSLKKTKEMRNGLDVFDAVGAVPIELSLVASL